MNRVIPTTAVCLVLVAALAGCGARGPILSNLGTIAKATDSEVDNLLGIVIRSGESTEAAAARTAAQYEELHSSNELQLICSVAAKVADNAIDQWNPDALRAELGNPVTDAGQMLKGYLPIADDPVLKDVAKVSITAIDNVFC